MGDFSCANSGPKFRSSICALMKPEIWILRRTISLENQIQVLTRRPVVRFAARVIFSYPEKCHIFQSLRSARCRALRASSPETPPSGRVLRLSRLRCSRGALRARPHVSAVCQRARCKGYKKSKGEELTFEDFEELAGGGVKSQRQVQFLCPKMNHVSMTELLSKDSSGIKITPIYA